ncbi:MAG: 16S rRNA (cytosine(1402)-N(4))-methyltransferase RsmH [Candidatus Shapirobacteria bacterium]
MNYHQPVLLTEIISKLNPASNKIYIDCTLGHGGHSQALLDKGAIVYGIDADKNNLKIATDRLNNKNLHPILGNFKDIKQIWQKNINTPVDGILVDLGLSNNQQSESGKGFSFNDTQSIDMRLDPETQEISAENIINTYDETQLYLLFSKVAQEQYAHPLAQKIIASRQKKTIKTGEQLANIIREYYQSKKLRSAVDPATKIFMALRIETNQEFENLNKFLIDSQNIIKKDGIIAIISFHSGEDRIVKNFIKQHNFKTTRYLPTESEIKINHLSRSAVLRIYTIK